MERRGTAPCIALAPGQLLTLDGARGARIVAREGTLWVTEEGDPADHIVRAGESRVLRGRGRALVEALRRAWVAIAAPGVEARPEPLTPHERALARRHEIFSRYC